eukprot:TRINITY_DN11315_c0_g1_i1.p1 TRINITY_DN11315_c0_g1~~TRINITY_DN11315_c0_g1_i1.p1  ORF type:complete len:124 (-),score=52.19 TRINITY_DN11315_c0_g1_i1:42-413(-)
MADAQKPSVEGDIVVKSKLEELIRTSRGQFYIIDVREPQELASTGMIDSAKSIPLGSIPEALSTEDPAEFERKYGFKKWEKDDLIIFHCRSGGRSDRALQFAKSKGFVNAKNYRGSSLEWFGR